MKLGKRGKQFKDLHGEQLPTKSVVKLSRHSANLYLWQEGRKYLRPLNGGDKVLVEPLLQADNTLSVIKISDSFTGSERAASQTERRGNHV